MRLILESDRSVRLRPGGASFSVESDGVVLSPFHLLAGALATCSWSVLESWSKHAGLALGDLELWVEWEFGGEPVRVAAMVLDVVWPGLPSARVAAARRAAGQCTVHHTLVHGTRVETRVRAGT
jgi:uncharacterized OsmC-like protein